MRCVLDGLLWLTPDSDEDRAKIAALKEAATYPNPAYESALKHGGGPLAAQGIPPKLAFYKIKQDDGAQVFGFPRNLPLAKGITLDVSDFADHRTEGRRVDFDEGAFDWSPRKGQGEAIDAMLRQLKESGIDGGVLEAPCGSGKTEMAIQVIRRLGVSTLILVDNDFLLKQWVAVIEKRLPNAKVGITQQDKICTGYDHDIVIAMIPSLIGAREYPPELYTGFGLLVYDECHHGSAEKFSEVFGLFNAKWRLGLTATPDRKDGMMDVYLHHLGPIAHSFVVERITPKLYVRFFEDLPADEAIKHRGEISMPKLLTALGRMEGRNQIILRDIAQAANAGRKILALASRREHVELLVEHLKARDFHAASFMGGMSEKAQKEALEAQVIIGTYKMAQEGLDAPALDTLLLLTPQSDIRQPVGRIQREHAGKKHPLIVDYVDRKIGLCMGLFFARKKRYWSLGITEN